jgi:hypothetical protein
MGDLNYTQAGIDSYTCIRFSNMVLCARSQFVIPESTNGPRDLFVKVPCSDRMPCTIDVSIPIRFRSASEACLITDFLEPGCLGATAVGILVRDVGLCIFKVASFHFYSRAIWIAWPDHDC